MSVINGTKVCFNSFILGVVVGFSIVILFCLLLPWTVTRERETANVLKDEGVKSRYILGKEIAIKKDNNNISVGCSNRTLDLLVLIPSSPNGDVQRNTIRNTWMKDPTSNLIQVTVKFMIGLLGVSNKRVTSLREEQEEHDDLLLMPELKDSYYNLSLKMKLGLSWVNENFDFDYIIKTDDDTYVRIDNIAKTLRELNCENSLQLGFFIGNAFPRHKKKWAENHWFKCPHYLPYAVGGGYILSRRAVRMAMRYSDRLIIYRSEDVTVSSWLAPYKLVRKHDINLNVEMKSRGCKNSFLISHQEHADSDSFNRKHFRLMNNGTLCRKETEIVPAYEYNWSSSPLSCCIRLHGLHVNVTRWKFHNWKQRSDERPRNNLWGTTLINSSLDQN